MLTRVLVLVCLATAGPAWAQTCHLPPDSHEARLLAFFEAPLAFSTATGPEQHEPLTVRLGVEVSPLPSPDSSLRQTGVCYLAKGEHTSLAPVFPRPRITVWLPFGFAVEASYDPPIPIAQANVDIGSLALAYTHRIVSLPGADLALGLRAQGTLGHITGPITCPQSALQLTDTSAACYGTKPSKDAFNPAMFGVEGSLGAAFLNGHLATYVGGGLSRLYPTFDVGFHAQPVYNPTVGIGTVYPYATPYLPHLVVDLTRGTVFGGVVWHVTRAFDVNTQVYSVPKDVTTFRFGAGYRIGT
jgi:hypothetical protein